MPALARIFPLPQASNRSGLPGVAFRNPQRTPLCGRLSRASTTPGSVSVRPHARRVCHRSRARIAVSAALLPTGFLATDTALPVLAAACAIPPLLGYWKREYTVSYGYAGAMALAGGLPLAAGGLSELAFTHALLICLYGLRLGAFLLWRQLNIKKFRDFVERIEQKAPPKRLQRSPFILSVALLYLGMAAPLVLSARYAAAASSSSVLICKLALGAMALGGIVEAMGDLQKSYYKARAPDRWVDRGLYAWMRHPNYTGEQFLWAGSLVAGLACALPDLSNCWPWVVGAILGCIGIQFTLMMATTLLEKKQQENYGNDIAFRGYTAGTWAGFTLPGKKD